MPITPVSVFEAVMRMTLDGRAYYNVVHYTQSNQDAELADWPTVPSLLSDAIDAIWGVEIMPLLSVDAEYDQITLNRYDSWYLYPPIPPADPDTEQILIPYLARQLITPYGPQAGGVSGDYQPAFSSVRIRKATGYPGRKRRGHANISGLGESSTTGNSLASGVLAAWDAAATSMFANVITVTDGFGTPFNFGPVVWSLAWARESGATPGSAANQGTFRVTAATVNRLLGTMTRRKKRAP